MKKLVLFGIIAVVSIWFICCKDNKIANVYVVGWEENADGVKVAKLWKNSITEDLTDGSTEAQANSIFVSDSNVYIVGFEKNAKGISLAKLWKNGEAINLTDGRYDAVANSVYVSDRGDVYIVGNEKNKKDQSTARLWKNEIPQDFARETNNSEAHSVYVSNNNVYVAGSGWGYKIDGQIVHGANQRARLWKNGVIQKMGSSFDDDFILNGSSTAYSVYAENHGEDDIVMVAGVQQEESFYSGCDAATVWVNGEAQAFTNGRDFAGMKSIFSVKEETQMYVVGYEWVKKDLRAARLWLVGKNNENLILDHVYKSSCANSVYVHDGNVYVAGEDGYFAKLWKNGTGRNLSNGDNKAVATAIFVK